MRIALSIGRKKKDGLKEGRCWAGGEKFTDSIQIDPGDRPMGLGRGQGREGTQVSHTSRNGYASEIWIPGPILS